MTLRPLFHPAIALSLAAGLMLASGCDDAGDANDPGASDEGTVSYAGFALTADDESDDDFTEDADPQPLIDALGDALDDGTDEEPSADELDADPIAERPDMIARTVLVVWGRPVLDPSFAAPVEWKGQISSSVAHIRVLRKLRFEANDRLIPDGDPQAVSFKTITGPHHDGLLIRIVAPRQASTLAGTLAFRTTYFQKTISLGDLLDGYHESFSADEEGNFLHISTVMEHRCGHGILRLRWQRKSARGGILGGKYYDEQGNVSGYVAGLWGRVNGKRRFKGFFLNTERRYAGVVKGAYTPFPAAAAMPTAGGVFRGLWKVKNQPVGGVLFGVYRVGEQPGQGVAYGHWLARCPDQDGECAADLSLPEPAAPACDCGPDEENGSAQACACAVRPPNACIPAEPVEAQEGDEATPSE